MILKVKEGGHSRFNEFLQVRGTEDRPHCHQGHRTTPGNAHRFHKSLTNHVFLGCEMSLIIRHLILHQQMRYLINKCWSEYYLINNPQSPFFRVFLQLMPHSLANWRLDALPLKYKSSRPLLGYVIVNTNEPDQGVYMCDKNLVKSGELPITNDSVHVPLNISHIDLLSGIHDSWHGFPRGVSILCNKDFVESAIQKHELPITNDSLHVTLNTWHLDLFSGICNRYQGFLRALSIY